jgi:hypothetical protein
VRLHGRERVVTALLIFNLLAITKSPKVAVTGNIPRKELIITIGIEVYAELTFDWDIVKRRRVNSKFQ